MEFKIRVFVTMAWDYGFEESGERDNYEDLRFCGAQGNVLSKSKRCVINL